MAFSATYTESLNGLDVGFNRSESFSAGAKLSVSESILSGVTNQLINFEFSTGSGILLGLQTNAPYDITLKADSTTTPTNTFIFNSSSTLIFTDITGTNRDSLNSGLKNIVTGLYLTNSGTSTISIDINYLYDPTP